jgi:hypothetical protein
MRSNSAKAAIPTICLKHGEACRVLLQLGFRASGAEKSLHEYLKSLRKFGIPFSRKELAHRTGRLVFYRYDNMMEIAVALSLRTHRILPWNLVALLSRHRNVLRSIYRRAYLDRQSGAGAPVVVKITGRPPIRAHGLFLDLRIGYVNERLVNKGRPRALAPAEAVRSFLRHGVTIQVRPPLAISRLAEAIVRLSAAGTRPSFQRRRSKIATHRPRKTRFGTYAHRTRRGSPTYRTRST